MSRIAEKLPIGNRLDLHFERLDVPDKLYDAAENLSELAYQGYGNQWQDVSDAEYIVAQREAITLCRRALDEVELILDYSALKAADYLRTALNQIDVRINEGAQA